MTRRAFLALICMMIGLLGAYAQEKAPQSPIVVASLHPILGDMAQQIGGSHVTVVNLLKPNGNLHSFEPNPKDLNGLAKAQIVLASGKNIEPYLNKLKESLGSTTKLIDLGASIPDVPVVDSLKNEEADHEHVHGETCSCSHGPNDPHWWHTPNNMKRAARSLVKELNALHPELKKDFDQGLKNWNKKMDQLDTWAKKEMASIPAEKRMIVTGHAAMNHFCKQYHFKSLSVQGISREDEGTTGRLAKLLKELKNQQIDVVFPEYSSNPKSLTELANSMQMKIAKPLNTDGLAPEGHTFETMFQTNVKNIKEALAPTDKIEK